MDYARGIVNAFQSRNQSGDWSAWVNENPGLATILAECAELAADDE